MPSLLTHRNKHNELKLAAMKYAMENGLLESCDDQKRSCDLRKSMVVAPHGLLVNIVA